MGHAFAESDGPHEAALEGWKRSWNLASDKSTHPERTLRYPNDRSFAGVTVWLGLERGIPGDIRTGAVYRLSEDDLASLDRRERGYEWVEVSHQVTWETMPAEATVGTYVPTPESLELLETALSARRPVAVRHRYLEMIEQGFRALGEDAFARYLTTAAPPWPVEQLSWTE
ncbi:hypothetical protein ACIPJK_37390 [Streptomyces roseus]|uniref:hypothetical protein n=1 Tax=Streptomyces roseus TaxID=66430 RepID=UPI0037F2CDB6